MARQNAPLTCIAGAVPAQQPNLLSRGDQKRHGFNQSPVALSRSEVVGG
jgi:hypothetical protein